MESSQTKRHSVLKGVIVPIITPVDERECVDEKMYRMAIRRCIDAGVDGIFAGGSAGMGPLLTDRQWQRAMEIAFDEVNGDCALLGGVITTSTARAIEKIRVLDAIGYGMMAVTPTFYIKLTTDAEMKCHFGACRDATDMEMVVYNIPSCTNSNISPELIFDMAFQGWMKSIKESSGNREYFTRILGICQEFEISLFQGNEPDIEWGFSVGAAGIVPVCANYEPATFVKAYQAALNGDNLKLSEAQQRASAIRDILGVSGASWIGGIMYGLHTLGIGNGRPVKPLQELNQNEKRLINELRVIESPII